MTIKRTKRTTDPNHPELPFGTDSQKPAIKIGGDTEPSQKYFRHNNGDIFLDDSFDLADSWWGLSYAGYPAQPVIVGRIKVIVDIFSIMVKVADTQVPVLIQGKTGTGKELVARALASTKEGLFEPVDCSLPKDGVTFEDTFFGRVDKVIGGALGKLGAFQLANRGTVFIDNIDGLSLDQQGKLNRPLQSRPQVVRRLGSSKDDIVDVRVIAATNQNLKSLVEQGRFRQDLYARLKIVEINLPPLRTRKEDIPLLTVYFLLKHRSEFARKVTMIPSETLQKLCSYHWPYNVRQLEHAIEGALALGEGSFLRPEDFPDLSPFNMAQQSQRPGQTSYKFSNNYKHKKTIKQKHMDEIEELLLQNPGVDTKKLVSLSGYPLYTVQRTLRQLRQEKLIKKDCLKDGRVPCYFAQNMK